MNESLKIGAGIMLGFILTITILIILLGLADNTDKPALNTDNLLLKYSESNNVYVAQIKKAPLVAKQEAYLWIQQNHSTDVSSICATPTVFMFDTDIENSEIENFDPRFEGCSL